MEKYTIERDSGYRCWIVHQDGNYLPNTYEDKKECLIAILEHLDIEVENA